MSSGLPPVRPTRLAHRVAGSPVPNRQVWVVQESDDRPRLDVFLTSRIVGPSRTSAQRLIRNGHVGINGRQVTRSSAVLGPGDVVSVELPVQGADALTQKASGPKLVVSYEDQHILVIDKPAGIAVHPGPGHRDGTLVDMLVSYCPEIATVGEPGRPGIVHRLDLDTSGLLIVARTHQAYEILGKMIRARTVNRGYIALVAGTVNPVEGIVDAPIGRNPASRTRQAVVSTGRSARTRYKVIRQYPTAALLDVSLETGRMHQIRVHMAALGHAVVGDRVYGTMSASMTKPARQFLHAARLSFQHPITGKPMDVRSELPEDLAVVLREHTGAESREPA